jgi:hypothetical protein
LRRGDLGPELRAFPAVAERDRAVRRAAAPAFRAVLFFGAAFAFLPGDPLRPVPRLAPARAAFRDSPEVLAAAPRFDPALRPPRDLPRTGGRRRVAVAAAALSSTRSWEVSSSSSAASIPASGGGDSSPIGTSSGPASGLASPLSGAALEPSISSSIPFPGRSVVMGCLTRFGGRMISP